jgi:hypothetical protein
MIVDHNGSNGNSSVFSSVKTVRLNHHVATAMLTKAVCCRNWHGADDESTNAEHHELVGCNVTRINML